MDIEVTRWPPASVFPDSAPRQGIRADRHDPDHAVLAYKIWVTEDGVETAVYRPEQKAPDVDAFLRLVGEAGREHVASLPEAGYRNTDGELGEGWDVFDLIIDDDVERSGEGCSIGMGRWGDRLLPEADLLELLIEDVEARLDRDP